MENQIKQELINNIDSLSKGIEGLTSFVSAFKSTLSKEDAQRLDDELKKGKFDNHINKAKKEFEKAKSQINNA